MWEITGRYISWELLMEEMTVLTAGYIETPLSGHQWRFGALFGYRLVELPAGQSGRMAAFWRVSRGEERCGFVPRVQCDFRPADGALAVAFAGGEASLSFDCNGHPIAAGWIHPGDDGRRRAVVACRLWKRSMPAILHLFPAISSK